MLDDITYDKNGNIYIKDQLLYIDRDENICFEKINKVNLQHNNSNINYPEYSISHPQNQTQFLKAKVINDEISKVLENDKDIFDDEDQMNIQNYLYNPETMYINESKENIKKTKDSNEIESDEDDEDDEIDQIESEHEPYYSSYGDLPTSLVTLSNANYETYVVNSKTLNVLFNNMYQNDNPIYRITIYTNNTIKLNIIGTKNIMFKYTIKDDDIIVEKDIIEYELTL